MDIFIRFTPWKTQLTNNPNHRADSSRHSSGSNLPCRALPMLRMHSRAPYQQHQRENRYTVEHADIRDYMSIPKIDLPPRQYDLTKTTSVDHNSSNHHKKLLLACCIASRDQEAVCPSQQQFQRASSRSKAFPQPIKEYVSEHPHQRSIAAVKHSPIAS